MSKSTKVMGEAAGAIARKVGKKLNFPTYHGPVGRVVRDSPEKIGKQAKRAGRRRQYLGNTPRKNSRAGREVIDKLRTAKPPQIKTRGDEDFLIWTNPKTGVKQEVSLSACDMSHVPTDAVTYWNTTGIQHGARSPEVRTWMLDSGNYTLQPASYNRSEGAKLGITYRDP